MVIETIKYILNIFGFFSGNRPRYIWLSILCIVCFVSLFSPSITAQKVDDKPSNAVKLTILTEEFPPLNYTDKGKLTGFSVELIREIKRRLRDKTPIKIVSWTEGYKAALENPNTILFSTSRTKAREKLFKWVGPLVKCNIGFFANRNSSLKIKSLDDAKKVKKIATVTDYASEQFLKKNGFKNLESSPAPGICARNLLNGWVDLWVLPDIVMPHISSSEGIAPTNFKMIYSIEEPANYIAFSKKTPDRIVDKWRKTLDDIKHDGYYKKLVEKWFPSLDKRQTVVKAKPTFSSPEKTQDDSIATPVVIKKACLDKAQREWLDAHPGIKVAPDPDCVPLEYFDENGIYSGIAADYVKLTEKKLDIEFKIVHLKNWDEVIEKIKNKEVDMLGGISYTPERSKYLLFTKPYQKLDVYIIMRKDTSGEYTLKELQEKQSKIAIVKGYAIQEFIETKYPKMNVALYPDAATCLHKVSMGLADATLLDMFDASYAIEKGGITNLREAGSTGYVYHLSFAVRKDWPELMAILTRALESITSEENRAINRKWISLRPKTVFDRRFWIITMSVLGVIILVFLGIVGWNRALQRQVASRTKELRIELHERQKAEEEIRKYRDHLEDLVKERTGKLQESEKKFKTLFEAAKAAIFLIKDGHFIDCNDETMAMFGCKRDQILKSTPDQFSPPKQPDGTSSREKARKLIETALNGEPQTFEWRHKKFNGSSFDAHVSLNKVTLNGEDCIQAMVYDISDIKRVQEELKKAKEEAEAGTKSKSEFLANMSHEIRTPLNAILGFSQLIRKDPELKAEHRRNLEIINRSGEHLLKLINQILEMSKIEAAHEEVEKNPFDIFAMLDDLEIMFLLRTDAKGVKFILERGKDVPKFIETDEGKLRQVLVNLLGNAVKFTEQGSIVLRIDIIGNESDEHRIKFEVEDTGPGIAEHEMSILFTPFGQTSSGVTTGGGTGLGLTISQRYINMLGGKIEVHSDLGKGTIFKFDIPLEEVTEGDVKDSSKERRVIGLKPGQPEYKILVVEDEQENLQLMKQLLKDTGFNVQIALNGQEAVEKWRKWKPNLIWMDMRMPIMDGYEATRTIKKESKNEKTIIIALTASVFIEERAGITEAGCDDLLFKPFQESAVFELMKKYLNVEYYYEGDDQESAENLLASSSITCTSLVIENIKALPEDLISEMKETTLEADFDRLLELLEKVKGHNEDLANYLIALATNFEYDTLLKLFSS